ncbi:MAG TPA: hypothetical protein VGQ44_07780 [Gemmatimonadaceae bacterium]|nr:hypothetical protein [Gemmatimonadaceae bacterium]
MDHALEPRRRVAPYRWARIAAVAVGVITFFASSGVSHRSLNHSLSIAVGIAMVLNALAPSLREISHSAQMWALKGGSIALGVTCGFLFRLFIG